MKSKSAFKCQACNYESGKWYGKCPSCGNWNTMIEIAAKTEDSKNSIKATPTSQVSTLDEILKALEKHPEKRYYKFSTDILNQFWNQGLVTGSLTLLAGEPGLGKSTLALQLLRSLQQATPKLKQLYVTAEESMFEIARRSQRLKIPKEIMVLQSNNFEQIEMLLNQQKPEIVILDSIQTIFSTELQASPGSVSQVSLIANQFLALSKSLNISIIIIGHVTKDGQIAGPKTLEHLVDSVLSLESSEGIYRTLSFSKHRYGTTETQLLLKMEASGLEIITDPSLALLENLEEGVGVCYGLAIEKNLPMVVEIQSLVSNSTSFGSNAGFGRREAIGIKASKLNTILAIIEKYLDLDLKSREIYVQISGIPKNLVDDSLDLPVMLSILSSIYKKDVADIVTSGALVKLNSKGQVVNKQIFAGRLTLSGNLRLPTKNEIREKTASKLKFEYNPGVEGKKLRELVKVV
ncbi:MAG: ATPase domain-containing protein [bacterium]